MKVKSKFLPVLQLFSVAFFLLLISGCVSKSKYDEMTKQNVKLSDSLNSLVDTYINGKKIFQSSDSLFKVNRFVDAKQSFIEFKNTYPKSKYLHRTDSILSEINKKAIEVPYKSTLSYKSFYNAHLSMNRRGAYSSAISYFTNGVNEFKGLDFVNNEKEIQQFKDFINNDFRRILSQFSPGDITYYTANAILGAKLEEYGRKLKMYELKNE